MSLLEVLKALGDGTRLRLVAVLAQAELTVQELTDILGMGQSRISRHLKILADAGLLAVQRQGTWRYYRSLVDQEPLRSWWAVLAPGLAGDDFRRDLVRLEMILQRRRQASVTFFDRHARHWEGLAKRFLPLENWRPLVLASLPPAGVILDLGVGTGALLPALCDKARQVVGIDQSPAMLAEARQRVAGAGLTERVDLRLGEMTHLPLADGSVDGVLLHLALHHADRPRAIIGELLRVLQPGGRLVILDLLRHEQEWAREELGDLWLGFVREDITGWLQDGGFVMESYRELSGEPGPFTAFLLCARKAVN
ncbi:metalloregulator ArsR/SmtB family transcription factor [Desulfuromonas carbonis]|uniref:ArsR/SmtB family transcription factor n=1 Tax=Desulfuromonas sp. DDH964 TaxID=1823759 RepID=UPI00078D42E2|nr:metalloregulator ArsR/SmtB family transcription factor [Desulfuromonas sp. DDH964]AMV72554.1 menaquinone biosynthesis methyltransferase [Desulfuromonas sp. DDH964]